MTPTLSTHEKENLTAHFLAHSTHPLTHKQTRKKYHDILAKKKRKEKIDFKNMKEQNSAKSL